MVQITPEEQGAALLGGGMGQGGTQGWRLPQQPPAQVAAVLGSLDKGVLQQLLCCVSLRGGFLEAGRHKLPGLLHSAAGR